MTNPKGYLKQLQDTVYPDKKPHPVMSDDVAMQVILEHVARGLSPTAARRAAGISKKVFDRLCDEVQDFSQNLADAYDQGSDYLEDYALIRAHENDLVLMKLLEARRPEKWSSKRQINAGVKVVINSMASGAAPQKPIQIEATMTAVEEPDL